MDALSFWAIVLALVVVLVAGISLAQTISRRKDDARLQSLLSLRDAPSPGAGRSDPAAQRPAAIVAPTNAAHPLQGGADEFMSRGNSSAARFAFQELPIVFAAALRGRAM